MRIPTYIVKNHDGIFYFRYVIPKKFKHLFPNNKREFRNSLKTRCRRIALQEARKKWVAIHEESSNSDSVNPRQNLSIIAQNNEPNLNQENFRLGELVVKFINDKKLNITNQKTLDTYSRNCNLLIAAIGDLKASEVTTRDVIKFKEVLLVLPKNINQNPKYKKLTVSEIVKLEIPANDKLSSTSLKNIIVNTSSFLKWCHDNLYMSLDFSGVFKEISKKSKNNNEFRSIFSKSDLAKMFHTSEYQSAGFVGYSFRYWLPLTEFEGFIGVMCEYYYQAGESDAAKLSYDSLKEVSPDSLIFKRVHALFYPGMIMKFLRKLLNKKPAHKLQA